MLGALLVHLPRDSALAIAENGGTMPWSLTDHLIADVWALKANEGKKRGAKRTDHPDRPKASGRTQKKAGGLSDEQLRRGQARFAERRRRLELEEGS